MKKGDKVIILAPDEYHNQEARVYSICGSLIRVKTDKGINFKDYYLWNLKPIGSKGSGVESGSKDVSKQLKTSAEAKNTFIILSSNGKVSLFKNKTLTEVVAELDKKSKASIGIKFVLYKAIGESTSQAHVTLNRFLY